ncbi:MAG TPA: glycosyltransferase [Patescibacteria group bacterium]|nr:glycosyltransferase [Patescibacteria group bacterium]
MANTMNLDQKISPKKIMILSHLFPNNEFVNYGIFVKEQIKAFAAYSFLTIAVIIAPVPYSPVFFKYVRRKWDKYAKIVPTEKCCDILVHHPRYLVIPGTNYYWIKGITLGVAVWLKNYQVDIIHAHCLLPDGLAALFLKSRNCNAKIICTIHGSDLNVYPSYNRITRFLIYYVARRVDQIICVSDALREKILEISPNANVTTIKNGIDFDKFAPQEEEQKPDSQFNILFIGKVKKEKGIYDLLSAYEAVKKSHQHIQLTIVGDCSELDPRINKASTADNHIQFAGVVPNEEIKNYLNQADVFVLPSYSEGLPTVMLEAMAAKVPMILTPVGGIPEVVEHGKTALLIEPGDISALSAAITKLLVDRDLRKQLKDNAYTKVRAEFSWKSNVDHLSKVYEKFIR